MRSQRFSRRNFLFRWLCRVLPVMRFECICRRFSSSWSRLPKVFEVGVADLLKAGIVVVESRDSVPLDSLHADERLLIASAVPKRMFEFATGRFCARSALAQFGIRAVPLLADANRAPLWPVGIVGSITHVDGYCAAAVGLHSEFAGVGIDAEVNESVGVELWGSLFTDSEVSWLQGLPLPRRATMATVLFTAKEAFFKAQYSFTKAWLDFTAVDVSIEKDRWLLTVSDPNSAAARMPQPFCGRFCVDARLVFSAIAILRSTAQ